MGFGWDFSVPSHRSAAVHLIKESKPYCVVLAFPCGPWSALMRLNPAKDLAERRRAAEVLVDFAAEVALLQLREGRHFIMEKSRGSDAWKLPIVQRLLQHPRVRSVYIDQCAFSLKSAGGELHQKPTRLVTSSQALVSRVRGGKCDRSHHHATVLGGRKITEPAGHYPDRLAQAMVQGLEDQFNFETWLAHRNLEQEQNEVMVVDPGDPDFEAEPSSGEEVDDLPQASEKLTIPAANRNAVYRLHENTGHRSGRRLARALVVCGAPREAVAAARQLKCSVCAERRPPKAARPAGLPSVRDAGERAHIDLLIVEDVFRVPYVVCHITDSVTRYRMADILENKSTEAVVNFLQQRWLPVMGPPRTIVADQGREFISWEFEEFCNSRSIHLFHIGVGAPWQNGIAERSGGTIQAILGAIVKSHAVSGLDGMRLALGEAVEAYNTDVNEEGVTPLQAVTGRQPPSHGDVLNNFAGRVAEHSLIQNKPSLARQVALRETARLAMVRLHFSRGLRRAELARARSSTYEKVPKPGDLCYFWREQKYNNPRKSGLRGRLVLRRWHGPALMVAVERQSEGGMGANAFLSFKGQLTKCPLEHIRPASSLEQIAADSWEEAIWEVIDSAADAAPEEVQGEHGDPAGAADGPGLPGQEAAVHGALPVPSAVPHPVAGGESGAPALSPAEVVAALQSATSLPSAPPSARTSLLTQDSVEGGTAMPGTPVPDLVLRASRSS